MRALTIAAVTIVLIGSYLALAAALGLGASAIVVGVLGIAVVAGVAATASLARPADARP